MKRASRLRTLWIMICSGIVTGIDCLRVIFHGLIRGDDRAYYDKITRVWSKKLFQLINLHYKVFNPHNVQFHQHERYIIMCNHLSVYDIPLIFLTIDGSVRMVAKKELSKIPLLGRAMHMAEFVFIDRKDRNQAMKDLERVRQSMETGIVPWIAPEGTRSRDGSLLQFKKGGFMLALQTGAKIVPVGIRGINDVLPADTLRVKLNGHAEVHIGKPIDTESYGIRKRHQLIKDVRQAIIELAGYPEES